MPDPEPKKKAKPAAPKKKAEPAGGTASGAGQSAAEPLHAPPAIPPLLVFGLAGIVILAALGSVIYWVFGATSQLQYPLIIALLCFALSTVACLLFASNAKLSATLPLASVTMGGPAVIWIGTLVLFAYLFPLPPVSQQSFIDILRMQQIRDGWRTFPDWIRQLGELGKEIVEDEASHVRNTMDALYYTGLERQKVGSPLVDDLYVYTDDKTALEFMRLRGAKGDIAEVYFRSQPTRSGQATSLLLAKSKDAIIVAEMSGKSDWAEVRSEILDCLIVSKYDEGLLQRGDFVYFPVNKYRKDGNAVYNFGVLTAQPLQEPKGWRFRGFPFPMTDEIPVAFKRHTAPWTGNVDGVLGQLAEWLTLLDRKPLEGGRSAEAAKFLEEIRARLPDGSFSNFQKSPLFKSAYSARLEGLQEAVAITYEKR